VKRVHQITGLIFLGIGAFLVHQGYRLRLEGQLGPGPGFFPFWIGVALSALSVVWVAQSTLRPAPVAAPDLVPARADALRLLTVIAALVAFMLLLRPIGFDLAMLSLLLFLFFVMDRRHAVAKVVIAGLGSFGVHAVFEQILRVPLPYASLPLLTRLGF